MDRYISEAAEAEVIALLDDWATGKYGVKLTWAILEKASGYTRQALSVRKSIYSAYTEAKNILSRGGKATDGEELREELERSNQKIKRLEAEIENYRNLWVTWTHNAQMAGVDLNRPLAKGFKDTQRNR